MKIKDGFMLKEVAGSNIVIPVGAAQADFTGMITLNNVGTFIWKLLKTDTTREKIIEEVLNAYDTDRERAAADIDKYISKLREKGIIEG